MSESNIDLKHIVEAALMINQGTLSLRQLQALFDDQKTPSETTLRAAIADLETDYKGRGITLIEVATGFRIQATQAMIPWLNKLWDEKPPRYSRAYLETLVLIAYRQPITRAEIEEIRGVSVSSHIVKSMLEREWIRVVGHRDVPGRPSLFATTKTFLDYFNLKNLEELPTLAELRDLDMVEKAAVEQLELDLEAAGEMVEETANEMAVNPEDVAGEIIADDEIAVA